MQCPVCKADNAQGPLCRRCKADLALLFRLEACRERSLAEARGCLREGRWPDAVSLALRANRLRADAESRSLVAVSSLFVGAFAQALQYHSLATGTSQPPPDHAQ
jgi:hypothetical protein